MSAEDSVSSAIDLAGTPPEMRERLREWIALAESEGVDAVEAKLAEQNQRMQAAFARDAAAVARLLGL